MAAAVLHGRGEQDDLAFLGREGRMVPGPVQSEVAVQRGRRVGKADTRFGMKPSLFWISCSHGLRPFRLSIDVVCSIQPLRRCVGCVAEMCRMEPSLIRWKDVESIFHQ